MQTRFWYIYQLAPIPFDWPFITALVERWRTETHTFHLTVGEVTITLQDVAVLSGLHINGPAVTGTTDVDWDVICHELLGVIPPQTARRGAQLRMQWLRETFGVLPQVADGQMIQRYARAYILCIIGGLLLPNKTGDAVQLMYLPLLRDLQYTSRLSWGSAALAVLYRQLCRGSRQGVHEIAGPLVLLQVINLSHNYMYILFIILLTNDCLFLMIGLGMGEATCREAYQTYSSSSSSTGCPR